MRGSAENARKKIENHFQCVRGSIYSFFLARKSISCCRIYVFFFSRDLLAQTKRFLRCICKRTEAEHKIRMIFTHSLVQQIALDFIEIVQVERLTIRFTKTSFPNQYLQYFLTVAIKLSSTHFGLGVVGRLFVQNGKCVLLLFLLSQSLSICYQQYSNTIQESGSSTSTSTNFLVKTQNVSHKSKCCENMQHFVNKNISFRYFSIFLYRIRMFPT